MNRSYLPSLNEPRIVGGAIRPIAVGDLMCQIDERRSNYDPYKLPIELAETLSQRVLEARMSYAATMHEGRSVEAASQSVGKARRELSSFLRKGFRSLRDMPEEEAPGSDVAQALETYGWERAQEGDLMSPSRIDILSRLALRAGSTLPVYLRYPSFITKGIALWLGILDRNSRYTPSLTPIPGIRSLEGDLKQLRKAIMRVRHHYCAATDYGEATSELKKVGMNSKGRILEPSPSSHALEDEWGLQFIAEQNEVRLSKPLKSAFYYELWCQTASEAPKLAGISREARIGICDFSPLKPEVDYSVWVFAKGEIGFTRSKETLRLNLVH